MTLTWVDMNDLDVNGRDLDVNELNDLQNGLVGRFVEGLWYIRERDRAHL